jgi:hypothetical protein
VPSNTAITIGQERFEFAVAAVAVDQVDLRVSLGSTAGRVDVVAAEIAPEIKRFLYGQVGKVLVSEGNDFALSDKQGELVLAGCGELAELDAGDF